MQQSKKKEIKGIQVGKEAITSFHNIHLQKLKDFTEKLLKLITEAVCIFNVQNLIVFLHTSTELENHTQKQCHF